MKLSIPTQITKNEETIRTVGNIDFEDGYDGTLSVDIFNDEESLYTELEPFQVEQIISFLKTWLKQNPVKD